MEIFSTLENSIEIVDFELKTSSGALSKPQRTKIKIGLFEISKNYLKYTKILKKKKRKRSRQRRDKYWISHMF